MVFSPDSVGVYNGNYFGFDYPKQRCDMSLLSVGYDATVSYGGGAAFAPPAIINASIQVEIYDTHFVDIWQRGIFTLPIDPEIFRHSVETRKAACRVIEYLEGGGSEQDSCIAKDLEFVNSSSVWLNDLVYTVSAQELDAGRSVGLVGGDHSTPLGLIRALGERNDFGILHIDAHMDLRDGYEGFIYSHASIMRRALEERGVIGITQVGVRDFSQEEQKFASQNNKIVQFLDSELFEIQAQGENWSNVCQKIVDTLPQKVYISFDVDGLERAFCPSTGTPVPGGLSYNQAIYLLLTLHRSGRQVIGFDLCEVVPEKGVEQGDTWDSIVGARVLYKLCNLLLSN